MKYNGSPRRVLLLYQMPKTGSQTVQATLAQCRLPHQVFRFHYLSHTLARNMKQAVRNPQATEAWKQAARGQLLMIKQIKRLIRRHWWLGLCGMDAPKLEVIAALREPIGLGLSSVFENHEYLFRDLAGANVESCRAVLMRPKALRYVQEWFDLEIKAMLGIDVYARPFPQAKGYAIYENRFARLLVYRYEAMAQLPAILGEFLNQNIPSVVSCNVGRSKQYGETYREVKAGLRFPRDFVLAQCHSKMMRHFYSEPEREALVKRWAEEPAPQTAVLAA